jgi:hypothetical protein
MMPRIEAGETLDALHTQALGLAAGDATWKQEAVAKLQAQARGEKAERERPRKASLDDLAAMGIGMTIVGADGHG